MKKLIATVELYIEDDNEECLENHKRHIFDIFQGYLINSYDVISSYDVGNIDIREEQKS
jgi:hypothetical protein